MDLSDSLYIVTLLSRADVFLLIFVRFVGFFIIMPIFGLRNIPAMTKAAFSLLLALIVFTSGDIELVAFDDNIFGYMALIAKEFAVGLAIGYVVFMIFNFMYLSGFLTDQQIGLTMANVFDPVSLIQVPISGNLYYLLICMFFVVTGGHRMTISTICYSFKALPLGSAVVVGNSGIFSIVLDLMTQFFIIGTLLALPPIGVILVLDVALGVMARAVPRMNIFAVGMSLKIIVGLLILWVISPLFGMVYNMLYELMTQRLADIIKVMMP